MKIGHTIALFATIFLGACASSPLPARVSPSAIGKAIFVTRHMHKADGTDPGLTPSGAAAAARLADALAGRGVSAIFATPTRRAMETASPLAKRTGLAITSYDPANPQALVAAVAARRGAVLVVGHSNTVHDLIGRLGGTPPAPLGEYDYGRVFAIDQSGRVSEFRVSP